MLFKEKLKIFFSAAPKGAEIMILTIVVICAIMIGGTWISNMRLNAMSAAEKAESTRWAACESEAKASSSDATARLAAFKSCMGRKASGGVASE